MAGTTRAEAVARITRALAAAGIAEAKREAAMLATDALGITRLRLLNDGRQPLGEADAQGLSAVVARRLAREPLGRIRGEAEFWGLRFRLSPDTLEPRADSEAVVRSALDALPSDRPIRVLDLGTGTGCLLLAILHERPLAVGLGVDLAEGAVRTARWNARRHDLNGRAAFIVGDWAAAVSGGRFDLVVSNPPYIASAVVPSLEPEVARHDPPLALDGGPDGLAAYRAILADAARLLTPGGQLLLEVGFDGAEAVSALGIASGFAEPVQTRDLGDHVRALRFCSGAEADRQAADRS